MPAASFLTPESSYWKKLLSGRRLRRAIEPEGGCIINVLRFQPLGASLTWWRFQGDKLALAHVLSGNSISRRIILSSTYYLPLIRLGAANDCYGWRRFYFSSFFGFPVHLRKLDSRSAGFFIQLEQAAWLFL